jgi:high-affinity iron transporter
MKGRHHFLAAAAAALLAGPALAAPPKTPELVAKGKSSYDVNCAACHGASGRGDGVAASSLNPKPRNLATGKLDHGVSPDQIFATLQKGVPGTGMVPFAHLPEEERWAITYYVLDLRGKASKK